MSTLPSPLSLPICNHYSSTSQYRYLSFWLDQYSLWAFFKIFFYCKSTINELYRLLPCFPVHFISLGLIIDLFLSLALSAHFYHQFNYKLFFQNIPLGSVLASTGAIKKSKVILSHNLLSTIYSSSTNLKGLFSVHPVNQILGKPGSGSLQGSSVFSKFGFGFPGPIKSFYISAYKMLMTPVVFSSSLWVFFLF